MRGGEKGDGKLRGTHNHNSNHIDHDDRHICRVDDRCRWLKEMIFNGQKYFEKIKLLTVKINLNSLDFNGQKYFKNVR